MSQQQALTIPAVVIQRWIRGNTALNVLLVVGASVLLAISAQIAIPLPFTPVPLTLQPLAVILLGAALGSRRAAAAVVLYLLEGTSGFPVFSLGRSGVAMLLGPTGGYLMAYPLSAFIAGWFSERGFTRAAATSVAGMLLAVAVMYAGGWAWLTAGLYFTPRAAFAAGVVPFVLADIVKVGIAAMLLPYAQRLVANDRDAL